MDGLPWVAAEAQMNDANAAEVVRLLTSIDSSLGYLYYVFLALCLIGGIIAGRR